MMVAITKQEQRKQQYGRNALMVFCFVFACIGVGLVYPMVIRPIWNTIDAERWVAVPCRIVAAEVESHSDSDGTTYSVEITYEYQYEGRSYQSDRYDFIGGSSSGYKGKERIVERYKTAANPQCFVNPKNPAEAVLKRGWHWGLLFALFPLPFLAVGMGGLYFARRRTKTSRKAGAAKWLPKGQSQPSMTMLHGWDREALPVTLKSKSRWARLAGSIIFAAFWNGIVSVFVMIAIKGWQSGEGDWFLTLFMIPFVAIGIVLIGSIFYYFLALFNPRATVTLSSATVPLGGGGELQWQFGGLTGRIRKLMLALRGMEEATSQRGKNSHTERHLIYHAELFSTENDLEVPYGRVDFTVPGEMMHSFEARNNKVIWKIEMRGKINIWPDIHEEYKITVVPHRQEKP